MYLGRGGESRCYLISKDTVLKISRKSFITIPLQALQKLHSLPFSDTSAKLAPLTIINDRDKYIHSLMPFYLTPAIPCWEGHCKPSKKVAAAIVEMVLCLHQHGYYLCDLGHQNFKISNDRKNVILIDYNMMEATTDDSPNPFAGPYFDVFCSFFLRYAHYAITQQDLIAEVSTQFNKDKRECELFLDKDLCLQTLSPKLVPDVVTLTTTPKMQDRAVTHTLHHIMHTISSAFTTFLLELFVDLSLLFPLVSDSWALL